MCDVLFTAFFCVSALADFAFDWLLVLLVVAVLLSYWPLYQYVREYGDARVVKDKQWHLEHEYTCLHYCLSRAFVLVSLVALAIIHVSNMNIVFTLIHLPLLTKTAIGGMGALVLVMGAVASHVLPHHRAVIVAASSTIEVHATIYYGTGLPPQPLYYASLKALKLNEAQSVTLIPDHYADDHSQRVTKAAVRGAHLEMTHR